MLVWCKTFITHYTDVTSCSQPADQQLSVNDLHVIMEELADVRAKWYNIGIQLGVNVGTLKAIEKQYSDPSDCLRETLMTWLKAYPPPHTWSKVLEALRTKIVGEAKLAVDLEQKYYTTQDGSTAAPTLSPQSTISSPISGNSTPPDAPLTPQSSTITTPLPPSTPVHTGICHL